jgi:HSP20 family protein
MVVARWTLFRNLMSVHNAVRRCFNSIRRIGRAKGEVWRLGRWSPAVDIYETADALILKAELPGFSREDVNFEIKQHALLLRGSRPREFEVAVEHYHCIERMSGAFQRIFLLPTTIDSEKVTISCQNGILNVRLPKAGAANPVASPSIRETQTKLTQSGSP